MFYILGYILGIIAAAIVGVILTLLWLADDPAWDGEQE